MKSVRKRLTYANVMSSLAVFLVVAGGSALAANQLAKNSVGTKQLKKNAVTAAKIKNGAVTGSKVNLSSLGTVPSATTATSATSANTAKTAETAKTATTAKSAETAKSADTAKSATTATSALTATNSVNANNADNANSLGGVPASEYSRRMFARVAYTTATPSIIAASPGITANGEAELGFPLIGFPQSMDNCAITVSAASAAGTQIVRRSTNSSGTQIQFAIKDQTSTAVRSNFELIAVC
jgi:hypothetical protein